MIVCLCKSVTREDILKAIKDDTLGRLFQQTQMGGGCGSCIHEIRYLVEENYNEQDQEKGYDYQ